MTQTRAKPVLVYKIIECNYDNAAYLFTSISRQYRTGAGRAGALRSLVRRRERRTGNGLLLGRDASAEVGGVRLGSAGEIRAAYAAAHFAEVRVGRAQFLAGQSLAQVADAGRRGRRTPAAFVGPFLPGGWRRRRENDISSLERVARVLENLIEILLVPADCRQPVLAFAESFCIHRRMAGWASGEGNCYSD